MSTKAALITPVGMTPSVVTEMIMHLDKMEGIYLTDVCLIHTINPNVKHIVNFIKGVINSKYPRIRVHNISLPFEDIKSDEDNLQFMKTLKETIEYERSMDVKRIYLSVSGGRKDMSASSLVVASLSWVDSVFHVIHSDVEVYNIHIEKIRDEISRIGMSDNAKEAYEEFMKTSSKSEDMEMAIFPSMDMLTYVEIPFLPYPPSVLCELQRLSSMGYMYVSEINIDSETLAILSKQGFVLIKDETIYVAEKGERILNVFR